MDETLLRLLVALGCIAFVALLIWLLAWLMRAARRPRPGANTTGLALMYLLTFREPPPPPETQIQVELDGEKDRGSSDPLRHIR
jgi:hypothetical protein